MFTFDKEYLIEFLEDSLGHLKFNQLRCTDEDEYDDYNNLFDSTPCPPINLKAGATKLVLFYDEFPELVVKLPLCGGYHSRYWDDDFDPDEDDEWETYDYNGAGYTDHENDYCYTEMKMYEAAKEDKLEDFFAPTVYLCNINDIPVYVSELVKCTYEEFFYDAYYEEDAESVVYSEKSKDMAFQIKKTHNAFTTDILAYFIEQYQKERVEQLILFLEGHGIDDDLHTGNIGFDENNYIRIIDYSSYRS